MGGPRPRFLNQEQGGETEMAQTVETVAATPPSVTLTQEQLNQLLQAAAGGNQAGLTAEALAAAFAKAQRPENAQAPMVSVFNPRGETSHPRPEFSAGAVLQNGMKLDRDTLSWEEIEAINALPPGDWKVTKADGQACPFTVKHTKGNDGVKVERIDFSFPCRDEQRESHRGIFDYCIEVLEQSGREDEAIRLLDLRKQLNKERAAMKVA